MSQDKRIICFSPKEGVYKATIEEVKIMHSIPTSVDWLMIKWRLENEAAVFDSCTFEGKQIQKYEKFSENKSHIKTSDLIGKRGIITVKKVHSQNYERLAVIDIKKEEEK